MSPTPKSVGATESVAGTTARQRANAIALGAVSSAILVLTLWPLGARPAFDDHHFTVRFGLADAIRNLILFVPLGVVLSRRRASFAGVLLRAGLLSAAIEIAQIYIPGRYGNASDLMSNAAGALLGAALHRSAGVWLRPTRSGAERLALTVAVALCLAVFATGLLLGPSLPDTQYYAGAAPELGHFARYPGQVKEATLGTQALPDGKLANSAEVRRLWLEGEPLRLSIVAGAAAGPLAPIFTIHDVLHREILLVGADRGDLVLRVRTLAQAIGLDRPAMRWPGILDTVAAGSPLTITARREGNGYCLSVGGESVCPLGFSAGSGWRLIWFPQILPRDIARWLNDLWLALLFLPLGFWLRAGRRGALAVVLAMGALFVTPVAGLLATPVGEVLAAIVGMGLGAVARQCVGRRQERPTAWPPTPPTQPSAAD